MKNNFFHQLPLLLGTILLTFATAVSAEVDAIMDYSPYPQPDAGYVSDHANLLSPEQEEHIERWLWQVESASGVEIIVVTLVSLQNYPGTKSDSVESFASALFDSYSIGNMPANDGVLLLVATEQRKARIELGAGYANSKNNDASRIMNQVIIPQFKNRDYVAGISDGTEAIIEEFANMRVGFHWHIVGLVAAAPGSILIGFSLVRKGKKGWGYVFVGLAIVLVLLAISLSVRLIRQLPLGHSSGWSAGGSGGFGGGFSGGGGATGEW